MKYAIKTLMSTTLCVLGWGIAAVVSYAETDKGTLQVPAYELPASSFLSDASKTALRIQREVADPELATMYKRCPMPEGASLEEMRLARQCRADFFYTTSMYKNLTQRYDVTISSEVIGGVYTEIFIPSDGILEKNTDKVLINVHGGSFTGGARYGGRMGSMPIASVGGIKVISIDYRMAPEYTFPAASEDVGAVYRELLKQYKPENIGLYGCSAGARLAAQSIAWFLDKKLPLPAAVGLFCMGAGTQHDYDSDSGKFQGALMGRDLTQSMKNHPYFEGVDADNVLAFPGSSLAVLSQFPPVLLISATRDQSLSSVVSTHTRLNKVGVESSLFVWEGLSHAFHAYNPEIPESREAYQVIVNFFDKHLGRAIKSGTMEAAP